MDVATRQILEKAFPAELRKTRRGAFGREITYIEVARVIERLNEAFSSEWSLEVFEHQVRDEEVVVLVKLSAAGVVKMAFGSSSITLAKDTGKAVSIGDDCKAAASDGLKKAASLFGVALDLCSDKVEDAFPDKKSEPGNVRPLRPAKSPPPEPKKTSSTKATGGSPSTAITTRQIGAIQKLGVELGMDGPQLRTLVLKLKGVPLDKLSARQASELIGEFQARLIGGPSRETAGGAR